MAAKEKILKGKVVSDKMQKGIIVRVDYNTQDKRVKKTVRKSARVMAHDEENKAGNGDVVVITEVKPISRKKRYTLKEIVEKAREL